MTYFSHIRAGLISTALLLTTALASPALAESLPEISPRQIASDVKVQYHPETGAKEYLAPSFDPFEEDRTMAGTASLRSVSNGITIDGQSVRGGALLDMTFYYNSPSNDPYDTRGYEDAVYLSGEYAPVMRRDNRILECNEQVQDVVYYHEDYYRPSLHVNLFRPYRHYRGHHRFDRGYGYARGYRGYRSHRGYRGRRGYRRGHDGYGRRGSHNDRRNDRTVDRDSDSREGRNSEGRRNDRAGRRATQREERATTGRRMDRTPSARTRSRADRRADRDRRNRVETGSRDGFIGGPRRLEEAEPSRPRRSEPRRTPAVRTDRSPRSERGPRAVTPRTATPRPTPRPERIAPMPSPERAAPAPRPQRAERSRPARAERAARRATEIKSQNTPRRSGGRKGNAKLRMMGFLPMASAWSRNAVRNVDVQCAREEMLTVHIPQERLDAARFDGLTVLVLDRSGQEVPVFLPPNYIEGFRQAVNGRVTPSVSYQEPREEKSMNAPVYQTPRPSTIESAPCPVGTTKQNDGTCLQGGTVTYGGYPTR